jgi:uncharacterized protein (DUF1015 family)
LPVDTASATQCSVPSFEPFTGLRYSLSHIASLDDVVCPPYDVISEEERQWLERRSPYNVVRVELPRGDGSGDPYAAAARLLDSWRDGGVLHRDPVPAFYGHRMRFRDDAGAERSTVGVIGALGLEPPGDGILPHEETTPKAKSDRLHLLRATRANVSPIWGLTPAAGLAELCDPPAHPAEHSTGNDRVSHELWPITDSDRVEAVAKLVGSQPVLIADGHHRYETALKFEEECRSAGQRGGGHEAVMALVVELDKGQLSVQAIHRLLSGLPPAFDILAGLARGFDLEATEPVDSTIGARMMSAGALAVVTPAGSWLARPRPDIVAAAAHDLDSSRLDAALSGFPPHTLTFQHGWSDCAAAVASGKVQAAVLLRPASVDQIAEIGRGGVRMPPKTTFFWPKPRTGMVLREV